MAYYTVCKLQIGSSLSQSVNLTTEGKPYRVNLTTEGKVKNT